MAAVPVRIGLAGRLPPGHLILSASLAGRLGLVAGHAVTVRVSRRTWPATARVAPLPGHVLLLPPAAIPALSLPVPVLLWARRAADPPVLDLGPVVGILAAQYHGTYRLFVQAARARGVLAFLFRPRDVVWEAGVVYGHGPRGGGWSRRLYPWPQVVLDRAVGIQAPGGVDAFCGQLKDHGSIVISGQLGDKWRLHCHFWSYPHLRDHLPETRLLDSEETLRAMLERWGVVYLKPAGGFMGRGIVRVQSAENGWCLMAESRRAGDRRVPVAALAQRWAVGREAGTTLVQQGLDLVRIGGAICDVRVLVLKDGHGRWRIIGMTVRRARPGRIVSNLHQGGEPAAWRALARRVPRRPGAGPLQHAVRRLVEGVLPAVDAVAPLAGEVGIDIGVDRSGRVWLIEVNPKPGRSGKPSRPAVYGLPMDYARFLAGFGPAQPPGGLPSAAQDPGKESSALEANPAST